MHMMLQTVKPQDFLISSGERSSLKEFVQIAFEMAGLKAEEHVQTEGSLMRPSDMRYSAMNPSRINKELGWSSSTTMREIISKMTMTFFSDISMDKNKTPGVKKSITEHEFGSGQRGTSWQCTCEVKSHKENHSYGSYEKLVDSKTAEPKTGSET